MRPPHKTENVITALLYYLSPAESCLLRARRGEYFGVFKPPQATGEASSRFLLPHNEARPDLATSCCHGNAWFEGLMLVSGSGAAHRKRQYLLILQISRYCLLPLQSRAGECARPASMEMPTERCFNAGPVSQMVALHLAIACPLSSVGLQSLARAMALVRC